MWVYWSLEATKTLTATQQNLPLLHGLTGLPGLMFDAFNADGGSSKTQWGSISLEYLYQLDIKRLCCRQTPENSAWQYTGFRIQPPCVRPDNSQLEIDFLHKCIISQHFPYLRLYVNKKKCLVHDLFSYLHFLHISFWEGLFHFPASWQGQPPAGLGCNCRS